MYSGQKLKTIGMSLTCYDDTGSWRGQLQAGPSPQSLGRTFFLCTVFSADFNETFFAKFSLTRFKKTFY
jgi:hypothetical protein